MNRADWNQRLSDISTMWTMLQQAHTGTSDEVNVAQQLLLERYGPAVNRYLLGLLQDAAAADDLTQEFAIKVVQGKFHRAAPNRGRFRDYVKITLRNLVNRYRRREQKLPQALPADGPKLASLAVTSEEADAQFDSSWRKQLLARTWNVLAEVQPFFHAVLRWRADHPKMPSHEMAEQLSYKLNKKLTADGVRQTLRRARTKFADLLVKEVAHTLEQPTIERLEEELGELQCLELCQPVLAQWRST